MCLLHDESLYLTRLKETCESGRGFTKFVICLLTLPLFRSKSWILDCFRQVSWLCPIAHKKRAIPPPISHLQSHRVARNEGIIREHHSGGTARDSHPLPYSPAALLAAGT
jgi:hypothetical protein